MPDHDSNDFILLPNKSIPCAFSPRLCAHAALCLQHGFEQRLGKPLTDAHKKYLVDALTTGLTSSNLEGLQLLVYGFTQWYTEICTAFEDTFTHRESPTKPVQIDMWLIREGMWVDKPKVSLQIEKYLKVFACDNFKMQVAVHQDLLNTRRSLKSPPIEDVPNNHVLLVWLKGNQAALTKGDATATVFNNTQKDVQSLKVDVTNLADRVTISECSTHEHNGRLEFLEDYVKEDRLRQLITAGNTFFLSKEYAKAGLAYTEALHYDPTNLVALTHCGLVLFLIGKYDCSIAHFTKARECGQGTELENDQIDQALARARQELVRQLQKLMKQLDIDGRKFIIEKKYNDAVNKYNEALKLNPDDLIANLGRGVAFYHLTDYQQCIEDTTKALNCQGTPDQFQNVQNALNTATAARDKAKAAVAALEELKGEEQQQPEAAPIRASSAVAMTPLSKVLKRKRSQPNTVDDLIANAPSASNRPVLGEIIHNTGGTDAADEDALQIRCNEV